MTQLHADLSLPADVATEALPWDPSPAPGVHRRRIERHGDEVARLTSIVRYAPGCSFPPHTHGGGEEYLVLEGTFSDEHGDHPAGTYVRNGVGTSHAPFTTDGCVILVRLWWMHPDETTSCVVQATPGVLHDSPRERVSLWAGDGPVRFDATGGLEVFVLDGHTASHPRGSWLRRPHGELQLQPVGPVRLLVRQGHLKAPPELPA